MQKKKRTARTRISFFEVNHFILASNNICSIKFDVDNSQSYDWLLDTGASISALKYKHALEQNIYIHRENIIINGIGGKQQAIGYIYLHLTSGTFTFEHKFYVFDTLPCKTHGILGQDFINKYRSVLNFDNNTLTLTIPDGNKLTLPLLVNKNNFVLNIAARSESIHYVSTGMTEECVVCASEICEGVFIASSLVTPINGKIPILILNTTEKELTLNEMYIRVQKSSDYDVCSFEKCQNDVTRAKKLLSLLNLKHLNKEEQVSIENLCVKFADIFHIQGDALSTTSLYEHKITLKPNTEPVFSKPYRLPYAQSNEIKKQINQLLEDGIIEPSRSSWSSPILLVPKKSDNSGEKKWRLVVDYRKLNNCIQEDKFPLPNINEILDSLSGSIYFSHLDLFSGYYQVKLDEESRKCTAFASGQYQLTRMPMGLKTSPSSFSRMITIAMSGLIHEKCLVYLDDLVIFGKNLHDHNNNLLDVFGRLRNVNLKLNPSKCDFLKKEILYLGHVVSGDGILPDPEKITVLKNYPEPKNLDEVKRFVAFANYYRKFIPNFAAKAQPLNDLFKKDAIWNWDVNCKNAFEILKKSMTSPPVLQYPDFSDDSQFILQTDASGYALGAILSNKDRRPVAYASRSLNKAEKRYPTIEKELLAIVWAIKHFRPYLYGRKFKIYTDHKPLVYLFGMKDPSSRLLKFRMLLEEYDYCVEYVKGRDNAAADALSRITSDELKEMSESVMNVMTRAQKKRLERQVSPEPTVTTDDWNAQPKVVEICSKPKEAVELSFINKEELNKLRSLNEVNEESNTFCYVRSKSTIFINPDSQSQLTPAAFVRELGEFSKILKIDEIYVIKSKRNNIFVEKLLSEVKKMINWSGPRICVLKEVRKIDDKDERKIILNDFHLLPTSGHAGIRKMYNNIKKFYFWNGLEKDIINYVHKCDKCQKNKHAKCTREPMVVTTTANTAFEKIFLDIVGPLDRDENDYSYILTIQCELSKYVEAYPLISKSSVDVARSLVNNFILRYGIPNVIATDRGKEFTSTVFDEVCKLLQIKKLHSTAYHHQSIGALENSHKSLGNYFRIQTDGHPESWSTWLPFWCFSYNTSVHSQTQYTPFELVFGKICRIPSNLDVDVVDPLYNVDSYPLELRYRIQTSQKEARKNLINTKIARKQQYDKNVNPITYKKDDLLLLKNETGNKLNSIYSGPYKVLRDLTPNVEIIKNGHVDVVHKNRTKMYYPSI